MARIYRGDVGTKIILNAGFDISTQTTLKIKYVKPDGTKDEWNAELEGTKYAYYVTEAGDLDLTGIWTIQLYVVLTSWSGYGQIATFRVFEPLVEIDVVALANLQRLRLVIQDKLKMVANETIGLGDGARVTWILEMQPIKEDSAIITVDGTVKTLGTDYALDLETGLIEFKSTSIPGEAEVIKARSYGFYAFSDEELNIILRDENNLIPMAGAKCLRALASDAARCFIWTSGDERVDQSKIASSLLKVADSLEKKAKAVPASAAETWETELEEFGDLSGNLDLTKYLNGVG